MNYGQWRSLDQFELLTEAKYAPVREYWRGLAENEFHLYEVVFTLACRLRTISNFLSFLIDLLEMRFTPVAKHL